ncbi:PEPxxWA-CTERM sorting domain-containing protein [Nitrogeniibacter aestuarii]|uniref:PEPxxWA-CTERM sorting domain-containing protein n=1 Tax=Nitrogeniibacter aestuarii TaxID=2815343 RepID=UPI001D127653|nr:PEPxxWA-CTERM sorting domain-containing protein [Nitrogeniibacter aestuarii]
MNFKTKALVAALALSAAGAANAAITTFEEAGGGSIVLSVWDKTNQVSAIFDLGIDTGSFTPATATANMSWDLSSGDYADVWAAVSGYDMANTYFMVFGGDRTGSLITDQYFVSTATSQAGVDAMTAQAIQKFVNQDTLLINSNALGNHALVENGANVDVGGPSYQGTSMGDNWATWSTFTATALIGDSLGFYALQGAGSARNVYVTNEVFAGEFSMSAAGQLNYVTAPVPEPETYALMLAGLGLIGTVARRRAAR